jgi:hypothetical protein
MIVKGAPMTKTVANKTVANNRVKKPVFSVPESILSKWLKQSFEFDDNLQLTRQNVSFGKARSGRWMRSGEAGQADFLGTIKKWMCPHCRRVREGVIVWIETKGIDKKGKKGIQSVNQKAFEQKVRASGGVYVLLYPVENDPINLNARVWQLIDRKMCTCFSEKW